VRFFTSFGNLAVGAWSSLVQAFSESQKEESPDIVIYYYNRGYNSLLSTRNCAS